MHSHSSPIIIFIVLLCIKWNIHRSLEHVEFSNILQSQTRLEKCLPRVLVQLFPTAATNNRVHPTWKYIRVHHTTARRKSVTHNTLYPSIKKTNNLIRNTDFWNHFQSEVLVEGWQTQNQTFQLLITHHTSGYVSQCVTLCYMMVLRANVNAVRYIII